MALVGKDQLVHEVAERSGLEVAEAKRAVDEIFNAIETELGNGNEVRLTGFGKFSVSRRKARKGRNPQTGEPMRIAAKKVPHFTAGAELRKAVPESGPGSQESRADTEEKSKPPNDESADETAQADSGPERTGQQEDSGRSTRKLPKTARRGPKTASRPSRRKRPTAPEDEASQDEASPESSGADEEEAAGSDGAGKVASVAASGAKVALVAAAGLAAGVAGGLAVTRRR